MSLTHNNSFIIGASGNPVDSTLAGQNTNETYLAFKNFSRIQLSNTIPTQLPNCPGPVKITNPLGNDTIFVGGLDGSGDTPYLDSNYPGQARGEAILGGHSAKFQVANANLLQVIALRNNDIIQITPLLTQSDFQTPTNDPPANPLYVGPLQVLSNFPTNGATSVPTNAVATLLFNRAINPAYVTLTNISVSPLPPTIKIYVDPNDADQVDIDPQGSNLAPTTVYTITAASTIQDTLGLTLPSPFTFSFTTGGTTPDVPPTVASTNPANNATGVAVSTTITIIMSEPVQPGTVNTSTVVLKDPSTNVVSSTVTLGVDNKTITITPVTLVQGLTYTVTVSGIKDVAGTSMTSPYTFSFTTTSTFTQFYNVSGNVAINLGTYQTYYGCGERIVSGSSKIAGFSPRKLVCNVALSSAYPNTTGQLNCYHLDSQTNVKANLGSIDASQLTTSPTAVIFEDPSNTNTLQVGDWIGVTTFNVLGGFGQGYMIVYRSSGSTFDGTNSATNLINSNTNAYVNDSSDFASTIYQ